MCFFDDHSLYDEYNGVVYDTNEGDRIAKSLGNNKAVIMANHGNLTVGKTVDSAVWWFISMERTCQSQILANYQVHQSQLMIKVPLLQENRLEQKKVVGYLFNPSIR